MQLPDFLTQDADGFVRVTGHRIGLHHVVRFYNEGFSPEMLWQQFPTLPLAVIHKVIAFYLENRSEVDAAVADNDRELERLAAESSPGPDLIELRRRLAERQAIGV